MDILLQEIGIMWLLALMLIAFAAGYIDAVAGGGGMLQLPALLFVGIPPVSALATNKIVGFTGTLLAVIKYAVEKKICWKIVGYAAIPCLIASYLGGQLAMKLNTALLEWMILLCIPVALFFIFGKSTNKKSQAIDNPTKTIMSITSVGFYDGLLGPGTGAYMAIVINKVLKYDFLTATASVKPLNLFTNLGAAIAFIFAGKVIWMLALPLAACSALGGWFGGHSAIIGGEVFIRKLLVSVLIFMLLANVFKMMY
ncbi:MAG: TSUP family transporter [Cocleimonas sp.]|nr:TSUP family transporter [Cocleimonas sp.]